jgi:hypothetical protein
LELFQEVHHFPSLTLSWDDIKKKKVEKYIKKIASSKESQTRCLLVLALLVVYKPNVVCSSHVSAVLSVVALVFSQQLCPSRDPTRDH